MHGERQTVFAEQRVTVYGSLLLICYLLFYEDCASLLLTSQDHSLMWPLLFYVGVQTVVQHLFAASVAHGARISLLTACIALLTLQVHYSFDNPYTLVLSVLFGTRSMFKLMSTVILPQSAAQIALLLLNNFTFCSMLENRLTTTNTEPFLGGVSRTDNIPACRGHPRVHLPTPRHKMSRSSFWKRLPCALCAGCIRNCSCSNRV